MVVLAAHKSDFTAVLHGRALCSWHRKPSIDGDALSCDRIRGLCRKEDGCLGEIQHRGRLAQWSRLRDEVENLRGGQRRRVSLLEKTSRDEIDADALGPQLRSKIPRQANHGGLGGRVVVVCNDWVVDEVRADVNHLAIRLLFHARKNGFHGIHRSGNRAFELFVEVLPVDGLDGRLLRGRVELISRKSIVDKNVDPASEGFFCHLSDGDHIFWLCDVSTCDYGLASCPLDLLNHSPRFLFALEVIHHNLGSLPGKDFCDLSTDTPAGTGDDYYTVCELSGHRAEHVRICYSVRFVVLEEELPTQELS
mmetsp:Transcript_13201/g.26385  ORF Transcript_13201/g.26385 Transcript_13201/m.26385 type:complete len:308 (-) Transcript_13201:95-1018(-)